MTRAPKTPTPEARVLVGRFGAPQGIKGEVRIKSYTAEPLSIAAYGVLSDQAGVQSWRIVSIRPLRDDLIVARIEGVADRTMAGALTGMNLYVTRAQLPPPEDEEEFYIADLIGADAVDNNGAHRGVVRQVLNYGAGDVLEIALAEPHMQGGTKGQDALLIPFTKACVPEVNLNERRIVIISPPNED